MSEKLLIAASSSDPYSVIIVDPNTGVASWSYKGSDLQGAAVGFVATLGTSGDHLLISVKDRPLLHALAVHPRDRYFHKAVVGGPVAALCTFKDGSMLFVAIGTQIFVWSLKNGELHTVLDAHYQSITRLSLTSDESILITASADGTIICYLISDIISHSRDHSVVPLRKWKAHSLAVRDLTVSGGANPRVVTCGLDHIAVVHSASLDEVLLRISSDRPLTACELDPAETRLFLGSDTGNIVQINLYDLDGSMDLLVQVADEQNSRVPVFSGHSGEITTLAVNADGSLLASGDSSARYCIWEISSRQCLKVSSMPGPLSSLQFVADWPSTYAAEYISAHPCFELQRNLTKDEKISMSVHNSYDPSKKFWREERDRLITTLLREADPLDRSTDTRKKGKNRKKQKMIVKSNEIDDTEDIIVLDNDLDILETTGYPSSSITGSGCSKDKKLLEKQRKEIQRLKKINAELYKFMASELTDK
ncbi:hypothetical protein V3C99_012094 [Haemonchus contortus]